jgi:ABC-2 type transport system permease protein
VVLLSHTQFEGFKYLSLNTLFNTSAVIGGGEFALQFAILAALGIVLYLIAMRVFTEKDLPL